VIIAQAFAVLFLVPLLHFGSGFFQEARGMRADEASRTLGIMALIGGGLGSTVSGILGDKLSKRFKGAYAFMAGVSFIAGLPCLIAGLFIEPGWIYLPLLSMVCFFYFLCMPAVNTQIANVTQPTQRAMAYALAVFVLHLLGDTMAPPIFGQVSDGLTRAHDPVTVDHVTLVLPSDSVAAGPVRHFALQYKSYGSGSKDHAQAGSDDNWVNVTRRGGNAFPLDPGWYSTAARETVFELEPVETTRIRFLQDVKCGPGAHPDQARLVEMQVAGGGVSRKMLRVETDSGEGSARVIDGDLTDGAAWASAATEKRHFASVSFGNPGTGRRLAFVYFSFSLLFAGAACLMASRTARKDMERIADSLTEMRQKPPDPAGR
jgi:hypothetical protein